MAREQPWAMPSAGMHLVKGDYYFSFILFIFVVISTNGKQYIPTYSKFVYVENEANTFK